MSTGYRRRLNDSQIVKAFMTKSAAEDFKRDPNAAAKAMSALRAIRMVDLAQNKK